MDKLATIMHSACRALAAGGTQCWIRVWGVWGVGCVGGGGEVQSAGWIDKDNCEQ